MAKYNDVHRKVSKAQPGGWHTCQHCGDSVRGYDMTVDHCINDGSRNAEWNLQTLCRACNTRKGQRNDYVGVAKNILKGRF